MYPARCPKCDRLRVQTAAGPERACGGCGLVFAKWIEREAGREQLRAQALADTPAEVGPSGPVAVWIAAARARVWELPPVRSPSSTAAHALLLAGLFCYSWVFILADVRTGEAWNDFLHLVNLVFHEAGHVLMMPFGRFMHVLGGTLGQLAMPLAVCIAFLVQRRDAVGAAVGLWWFGQSLTDCAPYIADARKLELPLLGGGTGQEREGHDWEYLLGVTGLAQYDIALATVAKLAGGAVMLLAVTWGLHALWRAHRSSAAGR